MKNTTSIRNVKSATLLVALAFTALAAGAQQYAMPWYKIGGGVTASAGGRFSVSGTLGQALAASSGAADTNAPAQYQLASGFIAIVVQLGGAAPQLSFASAGGVSTFAWTANSAGGTLQQCTTLDGTWTDVVASKTTSGNTCQVVLPMPAGVSQMFFRLRP